MTHSTGKAAKAMILGGLSALLLTSAAFAADIGSDVGAITGSAVRMRSDASTSSSILDTLNKGTVVSILGTSSGWYKVAYDGDIGYISADYVVVDQDGTFSAPGKVNGNAVNVRASATANSTALASLSSGSPVTVTGFSNGWYKVTCQYGTSGYIRSDFVDLTSASSAESSDSEQGSNVIATAKRYLGTRYVYGGASPSGFDCSGFTMYVYAKYGVSLPHTATGQWQSGKGTRVYSRSSLQAGDLVFFCDPSRSGGKACSHTGIYVGGGQFIHASSSRGVIISSLSESYYSGYYVGGLHIA